MALLLDDTKAALLQQAVELATSRPAPGDPPIAEVPGLLTTYYRHVAPGELAARSPQDVLGAFRSHHEFATARPDGTARVRVFTPTAAQHGWSVGGRSVVEIVTDDMPFLVDSMVMALTQEGHGVHVVIHPLLEVRRDVTGDLRDLAVPGDRTGGDEPPGDEKGLATLRESWMHLEIDRLPDEATAHALEHQLQGVLRDIREAVEDWPRMKGRLLELVEEIESAPPSTVDVQELERGVELLRWLADDHFAFLGFREYDVATDGDDLVLHAVPGSGLGILRADTDQSVPGRPLEGEARERALSPHLLVLTKANSRSTVHRPAHLDYVGIKRFDESGVVVGERRFLGLFSSAAYTDSVLRIPVARDKVADVLETVDVDPASHTGKAVVNALETYPRDELFYADAHDLVPIAEAIVLTRDPRQLRLFVRREPYGRYLSCLVYLSRDRYNTTVRERFATILRRTLRADNVEFTVSMTESSMAQVHFVVRPRGHERLPEIDTDQLERELLEASRSWRDDLGAALSAEYGEEQGPQYARTYLSAFPEAYKEDYDPQTAVRDVGRVVALGDVALDLSLQHAAEPGIARLKVFRTDRALSLSDVLPAISSMGVEVTDERPYALEGLERPVWIYDFGLRHSGSISEGAGEQVTEALRAIWTDHNEVDGFNGLVLGAGLTWRQATVLRAYAKYLKQGSSPFAIDTMEEALSSNATLARLLVEVFETRFGLDVSGREEREEALVEEFTKGLDEVKSLDHDRILRSYLGLVRATLRTNYFQHGRDGRLHPYIAFKLEPSRIPDLPAPRPRYEVFVYSPRVEGVHLRFGAVARGGLRWSDRRDDFRTEVLGLVKAQMVKNTVIVPVGAKGGFYCKQLPDPSDRDAWLAEGIECYKTFISGLLDVTDNLVEGEVVPAAEVVRHDGDDTYMVVAADKGTARFSDIANGVSRDYGYWLGDAFASGGSAGYDHKGMGITARGAWVSVQRHFRELGVDCQAEDFTCVGIGDMSGDVFGNGLLRSEHTRLVAAFDHRDIFLDPDPDPAVSYRERRRLFELPRSSWQDYEESLISKGGGVFSRQLKSVPVSPQVREALGLAEEVEELPPNELIHAILLAPVDLLYNGGIGTYVKASTETHADAGDKSNDAIRVDGRDLRARIVGEGGNLGCTQLGRIEYARSGRDGEGGAINTDFIDNSAGVDTSDHEVNIKILLDKVVHAGNLAGEDRNTLLAAMTDEVAELVLRDNYEQNLALANADANAASMLHVHEDWMRTLERDGWIDRELEGLPSRKEVRRRLERGEGLSQPEMSVLMSWTKIVLAEDLLASDLPEDPYLKVDLFAYFPHRMRQHYRPQMLDHPLRREIIVTQVVNDLVNGAGMTFWPRLAGETGASAAELTNANFVAREIFGSLGLRDEIKTWDNKLPASVLTGMRIEMRTLCERASRWLVNHHRPPLDSEDLVEFYSVPVQRLMGELPGLLTGGEQEMFEHRRDKLVAQGVPADLATRVAVLPPAYMLLDLVQTAHREGVDATELTRVHFVLGERLGIPALVGRILELPRDDRWHTMARAALRDDLYGVHTQLTAQAMATGETGGGAEGAAARVAAWEDRVGPVVDRSADTLQEICSDADADLARMSVGLRVVRTLLS